MDNEIYNYLVETIDSLDKIVEYLTLWGNTKEQDIATQKLKEAIFWLTYGIDIGEE